MVACAVTRYVKRATSSAHVLAASPVTEAGWRKSLTPQNEYGSNDVADGIYLDVDRLDALSTYLDGHPEFDPFSTCLVTPEMQKEIGMCVKQFSVPMEPSRVLYRSVAV